MARWLLEAVMMAVISGNFMIPHLTQERQRTKQGLVIQHQMIYPFPLNIVSSLKPLQSLPLCCILRHNRLCYDVLHPAQLFKQ